MCVKGIKLSCDLLAKKLSSKNFPAQSKTVDEFVLRSVALELLFIRHRYPRLLVLSCCVTCTCAGPIRFTATITTYQCAVYAGGCDGDGDGDGDCDGDGDGDCYGLCMTTIIGKSRTRVTLPLVGYF